MEIIDAHVHTLECGIMCGGDVNVEFAEVNSGLKDRGIERALLMPINDTSWQPVKKMNDYLVDIVSRNKEYVGFIDIDISKAHFYGGIKELESEIVHYYNQGLKGIKVHLQNLGVYADDWRLLPVYRLAGELDLPITIHCHPGSPPGLSDHSNPIAIEKIVRVFHKTEFIIAHFGGIKYFYDMLHLNHNNVYFETSGIMPVLVQYVDKKTIARVFQEIGYEKIMFGSDFPTADIDHTITILRELIPEENLADVMSKNILTFGQKYDWW
ncbi:MAG: amidohydrolase family protein [Firmicutes bacterium]|nr:amidohydrolase family protein [Bacillota bacterium]